MISFVVLGEPTAKGRPRFFKAGDFVRTYTPKETLIAENDFKIQAMSHRPITPWTTSIYLEVKIFRSIPKSMSKKNVPLAEAGTLRPITRPDADNYLKLVCDAMNGIFWKDDSQVVDMIVRKYYSANPRIEVKLEEFL